MWNCVQEMDNVMGNGSVETEGGLSGNNEQGICLICSKGEE
jgi:hypothetical protein